MRIAISEKIILLLVFITLLHVTSSCSLRSVSNPQQQNISSQAYLKSPLPSPTGFVNDYANVFDLDSKQRLESLLVELKKKSDIEFAVVTVDTTGDQPIFDYSLAVARGWGIGPKDRTKGGGLLLMLAVRDRQWRLQVSRSLEKDLPDKVCKELGDRSSELYKQERYAEGIEKYVKALIERLEEVRKFSLGSGKWHTPSNKSLKRTHN